MVPPLPEHSPVFTYSFIRAFIEVVSLGSRFGVDKRTRTPDFFGRPMCPRQRSDPKWGPQSCNRLGIKACEVRNETDPPIRLFHGLRQQLMPSSLSIVKYTDFV